MSISSELIANYSTFCYYINPEENQWDKTIHAHTTEEILLLAEEGTCSVFCNGTTHEIKTPAFIWTRAGSYHKISDATVKQWDSYFISFTPKILDDIPPKQQYYNFIEDHMMFALPLTAAQLDRLGKLFSALVGSPIPQRAPLLSCIFHQISLYLRTGAETICASSSYNYIFKVLSVLEKIENTGLTTEILAKQFHVSRAKLAKDFKKCTGHTIHAFQLRVRLQAARLQLVTTKKPLMQIASDCGFTNRSHLIRCFRTEYGVTPGLCRKNSKINKTS